MLIQYTMTLLQGPKDPVLPTLIKGHRTKTWWQVGLAQVSAPHTFQKIHKDDRAK